MGLAIIIVLLNTTSAKTRLTLQHSKQLLVCLIKKKRFDACVDVWLFIVQDTVLLFFAFHHPRFLFRLKDSSR